MLQRVACELHWEGCVHVNAILCKRLAPVGGRSLWAHVNPRAPPLPSVSQLGNPLAGEITSQMTSVVVQLIFFVSFSPPPHLRPFVSRVCMCVSPHVCARPSPGALLWEGLRPSPGCLGRTGPGCPQRPLGAVRPGSKPLRPTYRPGPRGAGSLPHPCCPGQGLGTSREPSHFPGHRPCPYPDLTRPHPGYALEPCSGLSLPSLCVS